MSTNDAITNYLNLIEQLVHQKTGQSLTNLQRLVLGECLQPYKRTYDAIAKDNNYSGSYIKQRVAPDLWHLLSELVGTNVTKVNCKSVLFAYLDRVSQLKEQTQSAPSQSINPQSIEQDRPHTNSSQLACIEDNHESVPSQPLPLEFPMESVPLSSPYYIQRNPHEHHCYQLITRPGALIRIKAPRQMGKTSLMMRIVSQAEDYASIILNFQQTEQSILTDIEKLLRWICANISRQLNLPSAIDDYWDEDIGSKMSCTLYLKEYILEKIDTPVVLVLEESSELFDHAEIAKDFFGMLRTWHEYTRHNEEWKKLRLILIQSTETYVQLNVNQSPFNVGFEVALSPFSTTQVQTLAARNGLELSEQRYAQLMSLLSGHPYLVRLALYHLANKTIDWNTLIETASTDESIFKHHLQRHLWQLQQHPQLYSALQFVLAHNQPVQIGQAEGFKLHSMGLVTLEGNQVQISCALYREYFMQHLNESRTVKEARQ
ncbi:MAG: AAA-like domain-containing protein [Cyanobacteria bacterium J06649_5]